MNTLTISWNKIRPAWNASADKRTKMNTNLLGLSISKRSTTVMQLYIQLMETHETRLEVKHTHLNLTHRKI